jgi:dihydrodipicolinate synthase/N-acetylneuraminate lyase
MPPLLLAASVTPLADGGGEVDGAAIAAVWEHQRRGGVDGVFCCGTTGEGMLLTAAERQLVAERFREACAGRLVVHAGAQTTADTVRLAEHAASIGANGVAVIPPAYYPLDEDALTEHFCAAADACAPVDFYLYAFADRSGYQLPPAVVERVRARSGNVAGLKVSEPSIERVKPYLALGLPVLVGSEPLIPEALAAGAAGSVSGLASAFPQPVRSALDDPTGAAAAELRELRGRLGGHRFIANLKRELVAAGVAISADVRAPLR